MFFLIGATGQIGSWVQRLYPEHLEDTQSIFTMLNSTVFDMTKPTMIAELSKHLFQQAKVIINCAAINDVDGIENDPEIFKKALAVNLDSVAAIAHAKPKDCLLISFSTDLVLNNDNYDGSQNLSPMSNYGKMKRQAEKISEHVSNCLFIRTSMVYSDLQNNFFFKALHNLRKHQKAGISEFCLPEFVNVPNSAKWLARNILELSHDFICGQKIPLGVHSMTAHGSPSRADAFKFFLNAASISTGYLHGHALCTSIIISKPVENSIRPLNPVLIHSKEFIDFGIKSNYWRDDFMDLFAPGLFKTTREILRHG